MGRWKNDGSGNAVWDENDSGPDQIQPAPGQQKPTASPSGNAGANGGASPYPTADAGGQPTRSLQDIMMDKYAAEGQQNSADPTQPTSTNYVPEVTPPTGVAPTTAAPTAGQVGAVPLGFDANKWNDPSKSDPKYDVGHFVQANPQATSADVVAMLNQKYPGQYRVLNGDTVVETKTGDIYDFAKGRSEGLNQPQWTGVGNINDQGGGAGGGGGLPSGAQSFGAFGQGLTGAGGFGGGSSSSGGFSSSYSGAFSNPRASSLYDILAGRAGQGLAVNARDPIIANQVDSFRAEQQRGANNYIDQQAEAQGPYGNLGSERRLANEHAAQATGGMQAQLMGNELTARRQEIQNALSQMGSMLTSEQQLALQHELGLIDANLRQQGVTNQNNQFLDQLGLNAEDRASYWDSVRRGLI